MPPSPTSSRKEEKIQTKFAIAMYRDRAPTYDTATNGWHVTLGQDYAQWAAPAPGAAMLDLACGTGLVTIPMATSIGSDGVVVGVDVTRAMLDRARRKELPEGAARVEWVEADMSEDLSEIEAVRQVMEKRGGFDVVSCYSALVLLDDPTGAVRKWARLLKEGGKMIVDVVTEDRTVQYLFVVALRAKLGMSMPFDREWVQGIDSLRKVYEGAGLEVEKLWRVESYVPEAWYEDKESVRDEVFEKQTRELYLGFAKEGRLEEARSAWKEVWKLGVEGGKGKVYEGQPLYVGIGRKPKG